MSKRVIKRQKTVADQKIPRTSDDTVWEPVLVDDNSETDPPDLGFIVEDRDDRRSQWSEGWQRLDRLDTDEPLDTNRAGKIPDAAELRARGVPAERFATDYHVEDAAAEADEEDFVRTSMLATDPDPEAGSDDFTDETLADVDGLPETSDIGGHVAGVGQGTGTTLPQDAGAAGFEIGNSLTTRSLTRVVLDETQNESEADAREIDDLDSEEELEELADRSAQASGRRGRSRRNTER